MSADRATLERALDRGEEEGGNVEFKERLTRGVHLADGRLESLAAQLRHRVLSGDGEATYVVGVTDDGGIAGIEPDAFSETMDVLSLLAEEAGAHIEAVDTWSAGEGGIVGVATIEEGAVLETDDEHIVVGTAGHVDHGKSTLVGSLVTGDPDDGEGGTRGYLDVQPHEVERGLSADLSYGVYGFDEEGAIRMNNPHRKSDRARIVEEADRLVSFVDTVGHEPWLRTTIRGLVGQKLDYGLLTVAADDGPTKTTREHLGVLLATDLPTIVAVTKADMVSEERVAEVE
ncbi:MAG: elongation factor 1-alpha, partial [Halobacteriales archaeon]